MKKRLFILTIAICFLGCRNQPKETIPNTEVVVENVPVKVKDTVLVEPIEVPKTRKKIKEELTAKGFKTYNYISEKQDTILMQQYFIAVLKTGSMRVQNEEESADLQKAHAEHIKNMQDLGYIQIFAPFERNDDMSGALVYQVPTKKMADSLANLDPMVQAGGLELEIYPWWAKQGILLE